MNIVISQPRYLPAINYLQRLYFSDFFILLDNVQRQSRGYENRNKLLTPTTKWLSIPIESSSRAAIFETKITDSPSWISEHKNIIKSAYHKHPFFDENILETLYTGMEGKLFFTDAVETFLDNSCSLINFKPNMIRASNLLGKSKESGVVNIVNLVDRIEADNKVYVSGSNGRDYGILGAFRQRGVEVCFHDWTPNEYRQKNQIDFIPYIAFIDYIFNMGVDKLENVVKSEPEFFYE
ncbi:WbqC family protein [Oceanimonas sp. MB9]|uniref:WbqC family protein n=1 Tax=Oceanimonas sp. MB9 TaxID=2588453 RepID=UPI0013F5DC0D|nr:hypothetical protein [Oceanimonas sp. MB9]